MTNTIDWLLKGDPAIRWQVQRDLLNAPPKAYEKERAKITSKGWGARLLSKQDANGMWGGGIYTPKWISTIYTLLLLRQLGLPQNNPQAAKGCAHFLLKGLYGDGGTNLFKTIEYSETCVNGMIVTLLCYFHHPDERESRDKSFPRYAVQTHFPWTLQRQHGYANRSGLA